MPLDLQTLTANTEVVERLGWSCDLQFEADPPAPAWFSVDRAAGITPIASDGTGGMFAQLMGSPRVLYVSFHEWPLYPGTGRLGPTGTGRSGHLPDADEAGA